MLESISDNWIFWAVVAIVHVIVLLKNPANLSVLYGAAAILYVITGFADQWYSLYGFYGWMLGATLLLPFNGVPLVVMLAGGFFAGRWIARL